MRREVLADGVELWLGDCRDILPTLGKVDAVVTDVPYGISQQSNGLRRLDYGDWDHDDATPVTLAALSLFAETPSVLAWCDWRQLSQIASVLPGRSERPLTWAKPNPPVLNGQNLFLSSTEHAFYGKLPGSWFSGGCLKSYWLGPPPADREHPTQKPEWLMKSCVAATVPMGGTCLDPFAGSGTTGVAAVKLGRKFIGIELDPGYFDIAVRRINDALARPDLFITAPAKAKPETVDMFAQHTCTPQTHNLDTKRAHNGNAGDSPVLKVQGVTSPGELILNPHDTSTIRRIEP